MVFLKKQNVHAKNFFDFIKNHIVPKVVLVAIIIGFVWSQNNYVMVDKIVYENTEIPKEYVGYKIVHITDICNAVTSNLVTQVKEQNPDIIVLSGGYSDANGNSNNTVAQVERLCKIAPVVYVYSHIDNGTELNGTSATNIGNNAITLSATNRQFTYEKDNIGTKLIHEDEVRTETVSIDGVDIGQYKLEAKYDTICLCGIDLDTTQNNLEITNKVASLVGTDPARFTIMALGSTTNIDKLAKSDIDLVLTGRTFGKGSISTKEQQEKGINYTKGLYTLSNSGILISGGVGNLEGSRFLNYPEIQSITLSDGTIKQRNIIEETLSKFIK